MTSISPLTQTSRPSFRMTTVIWKVMSTTNRTEAYAIWQKLMILKEARKNSIWSGLLAGNSSKIEDALENSTLPTVLGPETGFISTIIPEEKIWFSENTKKLNEVFGGDSANPDEFKELTDEALNWIEENSNMLVTIFLEKEPLGPHGRAIIEPIQNLLKDKYPEGVPPLPILRDIIKLPENPPPDADPADPVTEKPEVSDTPFQALNSLSEP